MAAKTKAPGARTVAAAVERDLKALSARDKDLAAGALAASVRVLAKELDSDKNSATSKSMCARALQDALDRLWELAPPVAETDKLDDLSARRTTRLTKRSAAA